MLWSHLMNFKVIEKFLTPILWLKIFVRFHQWTLDWILNQASLPTEWLTEASAVNHQPLLISAVPLLSRGTGKSARAQGIGTGTVKNGAVIRIRQFCNSANTGRLASTLKSVTYFCKNCQFWKNPWGYHLKSSVNECIIMYSALVHKQHVEYLSVEFMRTCPDEQPMSRRQFIHGKEPYYFAVIHWCSVVCWCIRRRYIMRHMSEDAAE